MAENMALLRRFQSAARAPDEFAAAIWARVLQLLGAFRAERAFVRANERAICSGQRGAAFFAYRFYFQRHVMPCPPCMFKLNLCVSA
jgi:hypothetical protein